MHELLCLTTSYPSLDEPHAGNFVQQLNQALIEAYQLHSLKVVTFQRGQSSESHTFEYQHNDTFQSAHIEMIFAQANGSMLTGGAPDWLSKHPRLKLITMPWNTARLYRSYRFALKKSLSNSTPVVIAHWALPSGFIAAHQKPIVYCHGGDIALLESLTGGHRLATYIAQRARGIICVSEDLRKRWEDLVGTTTRAPSFTLPMGVEVTRPCVQEQKRFQSIIRGRLCLVTVGRLVPIKGYHILLEALGALTQTERDQLCWLAAGDGPERDRLSIRAQQLNVPLILLNTLHAPARDALLSEAHVFIAPSIRIGTRVEGAPLALREAALSGCSLICTDLGGVGELLRDLPSQKVRVCDPTVESIQQALKHVLQTPLNHDTNKTLCRHTVEMKKSAQSLWSWESLGSQHASLIQSLL